MRRHRCGQVLLLLPIVIVAVAGCEGHGTYTSAFLDEVEMDRARLRAATEYDQAVQRFQSGDMDQALQTIDRAISLDDGAAMAYLLRGRILLERGQSESALAALDRGLALDPYEPGFFYYRGIACERLGRLGDALDEYRVAMTLDPAHAQYVLAAAEVLVELERLDEADALLTDLTGDFESSPGLRQALGHVALLRGDYDRAIRCFREAAMLAPDIAVFGEDLAQAEIAAGRFAEAETTLRRLLERDECEGRRDLIHMRASCLLQLDRAAEARRVLYGLIRSPAGEDDLEAWVKMIDVALMLDDDQLLRTTAGHLVAVAPQRHEGHLARAMWQWRGGDLNGALRSTNRAIRLAGDAPAPRRLRSVLHEQLARGVS